MYKVRINEYELTDPKMDRTYDIVSLSDLHSNIEFLKSYLEILKYIRPSFTCISGDIVDSMENSKNEVLLKYLHELSNNCKTYLSLGNHDFMKITGNKLIYEDNQILLEKIKQQTNCILLSEQFVSIEHDENININAITMPFSWYINHESTIEFDDIISSVDEEIDSYKFNILLSHSPNPFIRKKKIVDNLDLINNMELILCGHNHGGLTPKMIQKILKNHIGLVGAYNKFFSKVSYGYWTNENNSLLLTDGITKFSDSCPLHRIKWILNKIYIPDIEIIHIKEGNKHSLNLNNSYVTKI